MRQICRGVLVASVTLLSLANAVPAAHADTLLSLSGTLSDGGTASGFLTVSSTGFANPFPVTILDKGTTYTFQGSFIQLPYSSLGGGQYVVSYDPVNALLLAFPQTSLVGYLGGALCSATMPCTNNFASSYFLPVAGSALNFTSLTTSMIPTPEPGTIALLGSGLLGVAGAVRRRERAL